MWEFQTILASTFLILLARSQENSSEWGWMEAGTLGMETGGDWSDTTICPPATFVTGYTLKFDNNDTAREVIGLTLQCSELDQNHTLHRVSTLNVTTANNGVTPGHQLIEQRVQANRYAVGFSLARWIDVQGLEYVAGRRLTFFGENETEPGFQYEFPRISATEAEVNATFYDHVGCPEDWVICGVQGRSKFRSRNNQSESDPIVTKLRLKCCYYCSVRKTSIVVDDYTNFGSTAVNRTVQIVVGTRIDRRMTSGSNETRQLGDEFQKSNTIKLTPSDREIGGVGNVNDPRIDQLTEKGSKGQGSTLDWLTGQDFRVSTVMQSSAGTENSTGTDSLNINSVTMGQSDAEIGQDHWSVNRGTTAYTGQRVDMSASVSMKARPIDLSVRVGGRVRAAISEAKRLKFVQYAKEHSMLQAVEHMWSRALFDYSSRLNLDFYLWTKIEDTSTFICAPLSRCKLHQIYVTCGAVKIGLQGNGNNDRFRSYHEIQTLPTSPTSTTSHTQGDLKIPGENWLVVKNLSYWEPSGQWENSLVCPPNTVVTGHSLKRLHQAGLTGITLVCTSKYGRDREDTEIFSNATYLQISPESQENDTIKNRGQWGKNYVGSSEIFAEGFSLHRMELSDGRRSVGKFEVKYTGMDEDILLEVPKFVKNSSREVTNCPVGHGICGVTVMLDKGGKDLETKFAARFGPSTSTGFDWRQTENLLWTQETTVTQHFVCEPGMSCSYKQLVGECGGFQIAVNRFEKESRPFQQPLQNNNSTNEGIPQPVEEAAAPGAKSPTPQNHLTTLDNELTPIEILHNGQIWIETLGFQLDGLSDGQWGRVESCPPGSFVTGWNDEGQFVPVSVIPSDPQSGPENFLKDNFSRPLIGVHYFQKSFLYKITGQLLKRSAGQTLIFDRWVNPTPPTFSGMPDSLTVVKIVCPTDYVVCGLQTRKNSQQGLLLDLKFQCCYHCEPMEILEELDTMENPGSTIKTRSISDVVIGAATQLDKTQALVKVEGSTTLRKGWSDYKHIEAMFAHRLPKKSKRRLKNLRSKFDWGKQRSSFWTRETTTTDQSECQPKNVCVLKQLVGVCKDLKIPTSYSTIEVKPLDQEEDSESLEINTEVI